MTTKNPPRLYIDQPLETDGFAETGPEPSHYLTTVMRLKIGDRVLLFNGRDGEWLAEIETSGRKSVRLKILRQTRMAPTTQPGPWLMIALFKKKRFSFMLEKTTELGVSKLLPVTTDFTSVPTPKADRMTARVQEAAEQCRRLTIPDIAPLQSLENGLASWPDDKKLFWLDERGDAVDMLSAFQGLKNNITNCGFLIGPEGGFSDNERHILTSQSFVVPVSIGPLILRSETAAITALANLNLWVHYKDSKHQQ